MNMYIVLLLICIALIYIIRPSITVRQKVERGQAFSQIIYTDEGGGKLLSNSELGLRGKPDYIFQSWISGRYIPYEIKSGICQDNYPHPGDMMQLVAYFFIIEECYGKKPPFGKLVYNNKTFKIRNTKKHRKMLLSTLQEMRDMLDGKFTQNAMPSFVKCKNCVCQKTVCEWYEKNK
ncbi:MAG: CRISPR-associated protein Cas4 [Cellulosilyticaceae bacterium]